jgi:hypothetical protein
MLFGSTTDRRFARDPSPDPCAETFGRSTLSQGSGICDIRRNLKGKS